MKTYVFEAELEQDDDGRWGGEIPLLPGCNAWGYTREEALEALQDVTCAFLEIMIEDGEPLPTEELCEETGLSSAIDVAVADTVKVTL